MLVVNYSLSADRSFVESVAEGFSAACKHKVQVHDNGINFPKDFGHGRFELFEIEPGLSLAIADCEFSGKVRLKRPAHPDEEFHALNFYCGHSGISYSVEAKDYAVPGCIRTGSLLYTSSIEGLELDLPANERLRTVMLLFNRQWVEQHDDLRWIADLSRTQAGTRKPGLARFAIEMDLDLYRVAKDILASRHTVYMRKMFYAGYAKRLLALGIKRLAAPGATEDLGFPEMTRVVSATEQIEQLLDQPLPSLDDLADSCQVSKSRFLKLFKTVYQKNYSDFFMEARMQKAATMLLSGMAVSDVGQAVGYSNLGHFAKTFKLYYNVTPKQYQLGVSEQC